MKGRWYRHLVLAFIAGMGGCRNCDLVEAELRTKDEQVRELRSELQRSEGCNEALQRELQVVRPSSASKISPELASQTYTLKEIVLGRQTGGYNDHDSPGDEGLQVVVEPRDSDGHAIKVPGTLYVEALQISREGLKAPLSTWEVPPAKLRRTWQSGLLSTGYHVFLPWQTRPSFAKLRVVVRLTLSDNRVYEADKDVTIRLAEDDRRNPVLPSSETPGAEIEPLPPPRASCPGRVAPDRIDSKGAMPGMVIEPASVWQKPQPAPVGSAVHCMPPTPLR